MSKSKPKRCRNLHSPTYAFTLILTVDPDGPLADTLYSTFNDGTISTIAGVPQIHFHRPAESLEEAMRSAVEDVRSAGLNVQRVEMEVDSIPQPT